MANNTPQKIQQIIALLNELATASGKSRQEISQMQEFLINFARGATFPSFSAFIKDVDALGAGLKTLGASSAQLNQVRQILIEMGVAAGKYADELRLMGRPINPWSKEEVASRRISQLPQDFSIRQFKYTAAGAEGKSLTETIKSSLATLDAEVARQYQQQIQKTISSLRTKSANKNIKLNELQDQLAAYQERINAMLIPEGVEGPMPTKAMVSGARKDVRTTTAKIKRLQESIAVTEQNLIDLANASQELATSRRVNVGALRWSVRQSVTNAHEIEKQIRAESQQILQNITPRAALGSEYTGGMARLGQTIRNVPAEPTNITGQEIVAQGAAVPKGPIVFSEENLRSMGLGATAAENLNKKLVSLGITEGNVVKNTREVSNGITSVRFNADAGGGAIVQYSAHIDKAGNILDDTQKRFRTFGSAIARDVIEVLKWTVAIGLIYGPMRKFQELIQQATEQQAALADVQIVLSGSTKELNSVFESSVQIANETSSALDGVITGYSKAIAATGSIQNQSQRLVSSQVLLRDSMMLAKLAGMEQGQALDTLVGALRQTNLAYTEGQRVLDGWVAVSKQANVSIDAMASTFAIVGSAATEVGVTIDQLNGMVGVLAEATELSADEVGNAIRGFISGFQSDKAEQTLAKYGIAVRNAAGEVKSFVDVMNELAVMKQEGVLSEKSISEITNVVGGGWRRGAQLSALLTGWGRAQELAQVSTNATGDAAEALGTKMQTLESATTRLNNAFGTLAQTLGGEGGVLSGMTRGIDIATSFVNIVSKLVDVLGTAAPLLAGLGLAKLLAGTGTGKGLLGGNIPAMLAMLLQPSNEQMGLSQRMIGGTSAISKGGWVQGPNGQMMWQGNPPGGQGMLRGAINPLVKENVGYSTITYGNLFGQVAQKLDDAITKTLGKIPLVGGRVSNLGLGGVVGPAVLAGTQIASGQYAEAGTSMAGGFLAAVASGGNPIVTMLGSVFATAFYQNFLTFQPKMAQRWAELIAEAESATKPTPEKQAEDLDKAVADSMNVFTKFAVNSRTFFLNQAMNFTNLISRSMGMGNVARNFTQQDLVTMMYKYQTGAIKNPFGAGTNLPMTGKNEFSDILAKWMESAFFGGGGIQAPPLSDETIKRLQELEDQFFFKRAEEMVNVSVEQGGIIRQTKEITTLAGKAASDLVTKAIQDIGKGETGAVAQFNAASQMTQGLALSSAKLIQAVQTLPQTTLKVPSPQEAVNLVSAASEEQMIALTQVTDEILVSREKLNELSKKPIMSEDDVKLAEELEQKLKDNQAILEQLLPAIQRATTLTRAEAKIMPIIDMPDKVTPEQAKQILANADKYWTEALKLMQLTDDEIKVLKDDTQQKLVRALGEMTDIRTNVPDEYIKQAQEAMGIGTAKQNNWQFVDLRDKMGLSGLQGLLTRYAQIVSAFKTNVPGFELETSSTTLLLKDGFKTLDLDMRLFNLAMQELIDIEKEKTMEGMFNLPSGATFYVPFNAAALDASSRAGGGGTGMDMASLFAQYAPDPNAFKPATDEIVKAFREADQASMKEYTAYAAKTTDYSDMIKKFREADAESMAKLPPQPQAPRWDLGPLGPAGQPTTKLEDLAKPGLADQIRNWLLDAFKGVGDWLGRENVPPTKGAVPEENVVTKLLQWLNQNLEAPKLDLQDFIDKYTQEPTTTAGPSAIQPMAITGITTSIVQEFLRQFSTLFNNQATAPAGGVSTESLQDITKQLSKSSQIKLTLDINSQTTLMVDGRVLAMIIKPYLYEDLLRFEGTAGSVNKVIAI